MSTSYPSSKQTFTDPAGTSFLAGTPVGGANAQDHAVLHTNINDTLEAVEDTIGTNAGTNVLMHFAAGQFAVRATGVAAIGTLVQTLVGGTHNNTVIGTSQITGGTHSGGVLANNTIGTPAVSAGTWSNPQLIGTPQITGGTVANALIGTSQITGGTATLNTINANGQNNITITPGTASHIRMQYLRQDDTTNTYTTGIIIQHGWGYIQSLNGTTLLTKAVTFGTAFTAAPVVLINAIGFKNGTPPPTDITQFISTSDQNTGLVSPATTGFSAVVRDVAGGTQFYWGFSWIAAGQL